MRSLRYFALVTVSIIAGIATAQETGAWSDTVASLAAAHMTRGSAVVVQAQVDGQPVNVVVWIPAAAPAPDQQPCASLLTSDLVTVHGTLSVRGNLGVTGNVSASNGDLRVASVHASGDVNSAFIVAAGSYLEIAGAQVVGKRGAPVADADGSLASATSQLNALLARLRAHGLIDE